MAVVSINTKEPTQKQMFEAVIKMAKGEPTAISAEKIIGFAEKKIAQLESKNSKSSGKKSEEQEIFMDIIRDVLSDCSNPNGKTNGEILADERIAEFEWKDGKKTTSSRLTAYLTKMSEPTEKYPDRLGDVKRVEIKKTPYFSLV